jgi:hypothetical protein
MTRRCWAFASGSTALLPPRGDEVVGVVGFEPTISCSQSTCDARLRYTPPDSCALRFLLGLQRSNSAPDDTASSELTRLLASWRRHLTAQRMSRATLDTYSSSVRGLDRFLASAGLPQSAPELHREHIEAFITELLGKGTGLPVIT